MAEARQLIGYIDCPHCGKEVALKDSKKGFCYYNCSCGQYFARNRVTDEVLRAKARPEKKEDKEDGTVQGKKSEWDF